MKEAIQDVIDGAKNYEFWMTFGMNDVKAKYRRSKLGQLWITLSVAAFIFVIGGLYKSLLGTNIENYLSYISIGYVLWLFMQNIVSTSGVAIKESRPMIFQRHWPVSTFIF